MGLVLGKDVVLSVSIDGEEDFKPIACARSITMEVQNEFIETSGPGTGAFRTYIPSASTSSGTIEGLVLLGPESGSSNFNLGNVYNNLLNQKLNLIFNMIDETSSYYFTKTMDVYIESISESTSFDNITTFSINFKGTGPITVDYGEN